MTTESLRQCRDALQDDGQGNAQRGVQATLLQVSSKRQIVALELVFHETGFAMAVVCYSIKYEAEYIDVHDIHTPVERPELGKVDVTTFGDASYEFSCDELRFERLELDGIAVCPFARHCWYLDSIRGGSLMTCRCPTFG